MKLTDRLFSMIFCSAMSMIFLVLSLLMLASKMIPGAVAGLIFAVGLALLSDSHYDVVRKVLEEKDSEEN